MRAIVLLPSYDRDWKAVFFRCEWACRISSYRAGRAVSAVEVEDDAAIRRRCGLQESSTRIGFSFAGQVVKDEKQLAVVSDGSQTKLLALPRKNSRPFDWGWNNVTQHIRYFDRALSVRWSPLGRNYVFTAPGIEQRLRIVASGFTVNVFQPNTNALSTNDRLEAKAAHL